MTEIDRKKAAKAFAEYWKDRGDEKSDSQSFWLALVRDVLGVAEPEKFILFEERVKLDHTSFIDGHIPSTHVLIEQKKKGLNLRSPIRQSDGTLLNPFQQAQRYSAALPYSKRPRWIITCNFEEFLIYDMEKPTGEPESILLKDLAKEYYRLQFLVEEKSELLHREEKISIQAGELVGKLYDAILKQYIDPDDKGTLHSLNILCVRLVFCLYAEDSGIFGGDHNLFHNYIKSFEVRDVRRALIDLFKVLDTKINDRDRYLDERLAVFPYVNGGLFADENIEIPNFTQEIVDLLLHKASEDFDWSQISPTIFGAVFESTLNPETRRSGGMHYTSIENIHKVIDPLFLDELNEEFKAIKEVKVGKIRKDKAEAFRIKLAGLTFFDPACGSGNFLTETYICLRRLENEALKIINEQQIAWDFGDVIKVSIGQFYGIEINDFAVTVAKTALWIAESQMMKQTEEILNANLDFLPLKSYANIVEGNALRTDWETVVPKDKLNYIVGNPPYAGFNVIGEPQNLDMRYVFKNNRGRLDYVSAWFFLASKFIQDTNIECAYVSTNSVIQGGHISQLWDKLIKPYDIRINFAHTAFEWKNESNKTASVHCVVIGFSAFDRNKKFLYSNPDNPKDKKLVNYISPYLKPQQTPLIQSRRLPLCDVPIMGIGNLPRDFGHYIFTTEEEKNAFIAKEPLSERYIYKFVGSQQYLNNTCRWILYLKNCKTSDLSDMPLVRERIKLVHQSRKNSKNKDIQREGEMPTLFARNPQDGSFKFMLIPEYQTPNRKYLPISFIEEGVLINDTVQFIPEWNEYIFGILSSSVHFWWMKAVCGMLGGSGARYSTGLVYNNFPFPKVSLAQRKNIEETAKNILVVRNQILESDPKCKIGKLYDNDIMPPELRKAHQANDRAVMQAYGFDVKTMTESSCVAELMKMYQELSD